MGRGEEKKMRTRPPERMRQLVCFDFDLTLTARRVYSHAVPQNAAEAADLFGGSRRLALLQDYLVYLWRHGVIIAVVSWNNRRVIDACLNALGARHAVTAVYDRRYVLQHGGYTQGKLALVRNICVNYGVRLEHAVYVDDSAEVLGWEWAPIHAVRVAEGGMELPEMQCVAAQLGLSYMPAEAGRAPLPEDRRRVSWSVVPPPVLAP